MSTVTQLPAIPDTIPAEIKSKFNIALTNSGFQKLADEASTLVFNSDNIEIIKSFIKKGSELENSIINTHKIGKAPSLKISTDYDKAKNAFIAQKEFVFADVEKKYSDLCKKIAEDNKKADDEKKRIKTITDGISQNAVDFARKISEAKTLDALTSIERNINLEKSYKHKYQELLPQAIEKFNELNAALKTQKEEIKNLELLESQKKKAIESGNEELALEIMDKQDNATAKIEERKIIIQETAATITPSKIVEAETVFTTVKPKRSTWRWQVIDEKELIKKAPNWTITTPNKEAIDNYLAGKKLEGITGEEFTTAGVRFYIEKTY